MIQVVTYTGTEKKYQGMGVEQYSLHDIRSLDEYEITVIDLGDETIWRNQENSSSTIDCIDDFVSVSEMISHSVLSKIVLVLPQNVVYKSYFYSHEYHLKKEIKNMLPNVRTKILSNIFQPISNMELLYENTKTQIGGEECGAAFCFGASNDVLLSSIKSNKATAIRKGKVILTTLLFSDYSQLYAFLNEVKLLQTKTAIPEWVKDISMFDDVKQKELIEQYEEKIRDAVNKIDTAKDVLAANDRLKSVLYTNGDELVEVIFDILEEMLGCDLFDFEDKKKEDFLFNLDESVFIGEIKGVNHNVKNQNITQLELHYQGYLDDHPEADRDKIKAILIINHQRNKNVLEREHIMEAQIQLAERNGSLIVETLTLLKLLENYRSGTITREKIIEMLQTETGCLDIGTKN